MYCSPMMKVWRNDGTKPGTSSAASFLHLHKLSQLFSCPHHNSPGYRKQLVLAHCIKSVSVSAAAAIMLNNFDFHSNFIGQPLLLVMHWIYEFIFTNSMHNAFELIPDLVLNFDVFLQPELTMEWMGRGVYYWTRASRKEQVKVKMMVDDDDGTLKEVIVQGDDVQVEQMRKELNFSEKGMVYVKGLFERWDLFWVSREDTCNQSIYIYTVILRMNLFCSSTWVQENAAFTLLSNKTTDSKHANIHKLHW